MGRGAACGLFFFQAEDGIRDDLVTGVQTCALPISGRYGSGMNGAAARVGNSEIVTFRTAAPAEIGRASCRERVEVAEGAGAGKKKKTEDQGSNRERDHKRQVLQ